MGASSRPAERPDACAPPARDGRKLAGDPCPARGGRRHGGEQRLRQPAAGAAAQRHRWTSAFPAIPAPTCPIGQALEGYDGVAITGSGLHVYDGGLEVTRQIELARAVLDAGTPVFGSCWGLAGAHRRGRRRGAQEPEGPRDRLRPQHPADRGRPQASDVCRQARGVQRADRASRRGRDASRRAPPCSRPTRCRTCKAPRSDTTAPPPGACSTTRNIRCARSPRSCAASARA